MHLVGSHGSEFDLGFIQRLAPDLRELHDRLLAELQSISRDYPGIRLETKPASVAVHVRGVDPAVSEPALAAVRNGPASWPDIYVTNGKNVDRAFAPRHRQGRRRDGAPHSGVGQRHPLPG